MSEPSPSAGPDLRTLTSRLAACPSEHQAEPRIGNNGTIDIAALVRKTVTALAAGELSDTFDAGAFVAKSSREANRLRLVALACWVLGDRFFMTERKHAVPRALRALAFLKSGLDRLAEDVDAAQLIRHPDGREQLVRLTLAGLGLRPLGESEAQAASRLSELGSADERARKVREELAKKALEEAAAKVSRE